MQTARREELKSEKGGENKKTRKGEEKGAERKATSVWRRDIGERDEEGRMNVIIGEVKC